MSLNLAAAASRIRSPDAEGRRLRPRGRRRAVQGRRAGARRPRWPGQLSFMIENVPGTMPFVKDGRLRALAITSSQRSPLAPELPTMAEAGVPGYEMVGWNGSLPPRERHSKSWRD